MDHDETDLVMSALTSIVLFLWYLVEGVVRALAPAMFLSVRPVRRETILITEAGEFILY